MKLPHDIVILVADGARMLLLRNQGDEVYPDLRVIAHRQLENPPNRELLSDAPGVSFSTGYPGRSTYDEGDPHQANARRFLASAAEALGSTAAASSGLVVVAPPDALGELRSSYDANVREKLIAEIGKDLVKHPVDDIARLLAMEEVGPRP